MKHSIAHRGSIVWNSLSVHYDDDNIQSVKSYCKMAKKGDTPPQDGLNADLICAIYSISYFKENFVFY